MNDIYDAVGIEKKWVDKWAKEKTFKVDVKKAKNPFYNLMMFPYPSGEGLHVGHVFAFGGADTFGRLKRMKGEDVFEPMGFDSFGIHSENYAISKGIHPKDLINQTTSYFREKQLKKLGTLFDWDHQVITSDPEYYIWTQWLFTELFKAGLAVRKKAPVGWCPSCKTVLADEQVISGKCERCKSQVIQKQLEQWFFKITKYADRLLKNLDTIDWSENTKTMQRNWIGRSSGVSINFQIPKSNLQIEAFTTRADTVFGVTFMVLAPENPLAERLATAKNREAVTKYIADSKEVSEVERAKAKSGVFTGSYALNPLTKKEIPVWVADYVLMGYGTGAIMAVPAHDQRDYDFAQKYDLPIIEVIGGGDVNNKAYIGKGKLVNSGKFDSLESKDAIQKVSKHIEENQLGKVTVNYHLRDWLISRQRYWGPPIPMIFCGNCENRGKGWFKSGKEMPGWYPVDEKDLPVRLPHVEDYQPKGTGVSPLASVKEFVNVKCPKCGKEAKRETDVSDTFLDSAWYFLRYPTVGLKNSNRVGFDKDLTKKWLPVANYIGGNEHAVMHLLYSRFITMALYDIGIINFEEPFKKFRAHGLITKDGHKMSKSRGNVVNPNEYIESYGSDTLRMYLLFIGPYELGGDFSDRSITGVYRFLSRVWKTVLEISDSPSKSASKNVAKEINRLVKRLGDNVENLKFNTAIAYLMEFLNFCQKNKKDTDLESINKYIIVLSIFAPFITEELWNRLGNKGSVHDQSWPKLEEKYLQEQEQIVAVQVNGKLRDTLLINNQEVKMKNVVQKKAQNSEKIERYLKAKKIKKVIYVPGKIINFVVSD